MRFREILKGARVVKINLWGDLTDISEHAIACQYFVGDYASNTTENNWESQRSQIPVASPIIVA